MAAKKKEIKKITSKKKTSTTDKRFVELEKKLGTMGDTINDQNEFIKGASVVINTLAYSPELKEAFQSKLREQTGVVETGKKPGKQPQQTTQTKTSVNGDNGKDEDITRQVTDVVASQREGIVTQFESDYGIAQLKGEERKEARKKVESYLNEFGWSVSNVPLKNLRRNLEKAFVGTHADKLREEGKLEGMAQMRTNQQGAMGTFQGGETKEIGEGEEDLTKGQKEWADKLGVDVKGAKEIYLKKDDEYKRETKAEKKAQK